MSLRDKDYELAVKLGIIDENTKDNKCKYAEENCQCDDEAHKYELEIANLKDTIICLSKELLKKEEIIKRLEENLAKSRRDEESMYSYYEAARGDVKFLESLIDKIGEKYNV